MVSVPVSTSLPAASRLAKGFTIIEIVTVIFIILILVTLLVPGFEIVRQRMDKAACITNLSQLYVAANSYVQDHGSWPQVDPALHHAPNNAYYEAWIAAYVPYGVGRASWICPTTQRDLGGPDYTQTQNYRADYAAMPYDNKRITPFRWPTSPWFIEKGNVHGTGNLMIMANGSVTDFAQLFPSISGSSPSK